MRSKTLLPFDDSCHLEAAMRHPWRLYGLKLKLWILQAHKHYAYNQRQESLLYVSGGSETVVSRVVCRNIVTEDNNEELSFRNRMEGYLHIDPPPIDMIHALPFSLHFSSGFGFKAPTNEATWALAKQNAMDGKPILSSAGLFHQSFSSMKVFRQFTVCSNVSSIAN